MQFLIGSSHTYQHDFKGVKVPKPSEIPWYNPIFKLVKFTPWNNGLGTPYNTGGRLWVYTHWGAIHFDWYRVMSFRETLLYIVSQRKKTYGT